MEQELSRDYRTGVYLSHPRALSTAVVTALAQPRTPDDCGILPRDWLEEPLPFQNAIVVYHPIRDVLRRRGGGTIAEAHAELYEHRHDVFNGARAGKEHRYRDPLYRGVVSDSTPVIFRESIGPERNTIDLRVFPDARAMKRSPVVVSIRRPREFIASHLALWPDDPIENLATSYLQLTRIYADVMGCGGKALMITAEHLRQDPAVALQRVASHLEIPFHAGMLKWAKADGEVVTFQNNPFVYLYDESYPDASTVRVKPWFDDVNGSVGLFDLTTSALEAGSPFTADQLRMVESLDDAYARHRSIASRDLFEIKDEFPGT